MIRGSLIALGMLLLGALSPHKDNVAISFVFEQFPNPFVLSLSKGVIGRPVHTSIGSARALGYLEILSLPLRTTLSEGIAMTQTKRGTACCAPFGIIVIYKSSGGYCTLLSPSNQYKTTKCHKTKAQHDNSGNFWNRRS